MRSRGRRGRRHLGHGLVVSGGVFELTGGHASSPRAGHGVEGVVGRGVLDPAREGGGSGRRIRTTRFTGRYKYQR